MPRGLWYGSMVLAALGAPVPAFAQGVASPAAPSGTTVYQAAFFAPSAPRTALDIARLVPGFELDLGDVSRRGFAGAAGNVVVNGARPSSKSESLATTLSRIPASRVARVEVGPGNLYSAEFAGRSQVLNVVLSSDSGIDGNIRASAWRIHTGHVFPDVSGTALITRGDSSINVSASTGRDDFVEEGTDRVTDPSDDSPIEFRRKVNRYRDHDPYASLSLALDQAADRSLHLNARYGVDNFELNQSSRVRPVVGPARRDRLIQDFSDPSFELGGDVTRPLAAGAIKFLALATRTKRDNEEISRERPEPDFVTTEGFAQFQNARLNETLGRLTWTHANLGGFSLELGGEAVLNTLDNRLDLFELGPGGERTRIDLPADDAKVREKRGEVFVNAGRQLSDRVRVDAGLTIETSHIEVSGDAEAERSLTFWKPLLSLDWNGGGGWHGVVSLRRTVAQLDFFDFVAAAELVNDRVSAGNPDLEPQRAWELRASIERPILGAGLAKLDLGIDRISRLQDRILTEDGFDAPGNIGTGRRRFAALTLDAPLTTVGIPGGRLKLTGQLQSTRVHDPITGKLRNFTGQFPDWNWRAEFRRDVGRWSYGLNAEDRDRYTYFRKDEIDSNWFRGVFGTAFVEFRPTERTSVTLDIDNLLDTTDRRERFFFTPDRTSSGPDAEDQRVRKAHRSFGLTVKQQFGSPEGS